MGDYGLVAAPIQSSSGYPYGPRLRMRRDWMTSKNGGGGGGRMMENERREKRLRRRVMGIWSTCTTLPIHASFMK